MMIGLIRPTVFPSALAFWSCLALAAALAGFGVWAFCSRRGEFRAAVALACVLGFFLVPAALMYNPYPEASIREYDEVVWLSGQNPAARSTFLEAMADSTLSRGEVARIRQRADLHDRDRHPAQSEAARTEAVKRARSKAIP